MRINKIKVDGFKSIYEPVELDFDDVSGFWWIRGYVGSGKTTISEVVLYALFGTVPGKTNSDLISWGRKKGKVELWCTSKGHNIYILRNLKSQGQSPVYIEVDGQELTYTDKRDSQNILEKEYYDISRLAAEMLCIISFNNFKSVSNMNTKDSKQFLDKIMGFELLTQYAEQAKELRKNVNQDKTLIESEIKSLGDQILRINKLMNIDFIEGNLQEVDKSINTNNKLLKEYKLLRDKELREYDVKINTLQTQLNTVRTLGMNKKKEIDFIKRGICPTCGAPIDQQHLQTKEDERVVLLNQYNTISKDLVDNVKKKNELENSWKEKIRVVEDDCNKSTHLKIKLQEQQKRQTINNSEIDNLQISLNDKNKEYKCINNDIIQWDNLVDMFLFDIRSKILKLFIPVLNHNINKFAQRLKLPYTVSFNDEFVCSLNMFGLDQKISIKSLSTGQLKILDMVIILGILNTIVNSHNINILFLDELFSNLDIELRNEMCLIIRENLMKDNTIFITSHQDIDQRWLNGCIDVTLKTHDNFEKHTVLNINKFETPDMN